VELKYDEGALCNIISEKYSVNYWRNFLS